MMKRPERVVLLYTEINNPLILDTKTKITNFYFMEIAKYKWLIILVLFVIIGSSSYFLGLKHSTNDGDVFVWEPSQDILTGPSKNITDSATCSFKKSFNTFFSKKITNAEPNPPEKIYYSVGDDNVADTVTFIDLNTEHPKVKTNSGQSELTVLNSNADTITLIDLSGINDSIDHGFSTYKLLRKKGILIYSDMADSLLTIGPTGTLEMGYCH